MREEVLKRINFLYYELGIPKTYIADWLGVTHMTINYWERTEDVRIVRVMEHVDKLDKLINHLKEKYPKVLDSKE